MFKALTDLVTPDNPSNNVASKKRFPSRFPSSKGKSGGTNGLAIVDPSSAVKAGNAGLFSRSALEFISSASSIDASPYSEQQLLNAYLTSVYLYAALRRVSNLISRVKIVGEVQQGNKWVRLPETHMLNQLFERDGAETMSRIWLNHAVYGSANIFKVKTHRAILQEKQNSPIYDFKDGAVAGLYVLDKPLWNLDENLTHGGVSGFYVNQYQAGDDILDGRTYLQREETIFVTDWNPENPNRGKSMVSVCIHEAVANASIAQWISEYFTRGAMPFIMVSMAEDDPAMMTDSDLRKYKQQFENYWQGMGSSLRSVFFDRSVAVEQVGIPADEVAAPDLNETALEGIAATIGLDRELIVTPSGGSQERHSLLIKRAWEDTVIPLAEKYLTAFNRDLGLPSNMRLVLDVSGIAELDADRENKADVEIGIYESQLQSYNETRTRLKMPPVKELDGWYHKDGKLVPLENMMKAGKVPDSELVDYAMQLWDSNLAKRSDVLHIIGRELPSGELDGYKYQIEERVDLITSMWGDDLLTRQAVLKYLGFPVENISPEQDGYRSELERGADYGEWVTQLWDDNLLTRSQVIELLDMGLELPEGAPDGYSDEIGDRKSNIMDMWGDNLITRSQALLKLGYKPPEQMIDGYSDEIEMKLDIIRDSEETHYDRVMDYWGDNLITRSQALEMLGIKPTSDMIDGYVDEIDRRLDVVFDAESEHADYVMNLWGDNLVTRSQALEMLGITMPDGAIDGYTDVVENISDAVSDKIGEFEVQELESTYNPSGDEGVRRYNRGGEDEDDDDSGGDEPPPSSPPPSPNDSSSSTNEDMDDSAFWSSVIDDNNTSTVDNSHTSDAPSIDAAEESYLEQYGELPHDVLYGSYGDNVDYLPPEVLPVADSVDYMDEVDGVSIDDRSYYDNSATYSDDEYDSAFADAEEEVLGILSDTQHDNTVLTQDAASAYSHNKDTQSDTPPDSVPIFKPIEDFELPADDVDRGASDRTPDESVELHELGKQENSVASISRSDVDSGNEILYASLSVAYDDKISGIQKRCIDLLGDDIDVNWTDESEYHLTIAYAEDVSDETAESLSNNLPDTNYVGNVHVVDIDIFETDEGSNAIVLLVDPSEKLMQLHSKLAVFFGAYGLNLSRYSVIGKYKPHITIGYTNDDIELDKLSLPQDFYVRPKAAVLQRDYYDTIYEMPTQSIRNLLSTSESDYVPEQEAGGTNLVEYMSAREIHESQQRWKSILAENMKSKLYNWYHGNQMYSKDVELPYLLDVALMDFHDVTDKVYNAAMIAIDNGVFFEENSDFIENPIQVLLSQKAFQEDVLSEVKAWQRATNRSGINKALRFETLHIPQHLAEYVKIQLSNVDESDTETIQNIFRDLSDAVSEAM